jgi:hypothetical protein
MRARWPQGTQKRIAPTMTEPMTMGTTPGRRTPRLSMPTAAPIDLTLGRVLASLRTAKRKVRIASPSHEQRINA